MKRRNMAISVLTVLLILAAVSIEKNELSKQDFPFSVMVTSDGYEKKISCVEMHGGYYVFLPAYVEPSAVKICPNSMYDVFIGDQLLSEEMNCGQFPLDMPLELFFHKSSGNPESTVTFFQSKNVGTVYIDVKSGNMEYIHRKKGNGEGGRIQVYDAAGSLWHQGELKSIRGRGNATWAFDKKPYSITLKNASDLLGLDAAEEWILLSNAADPSQLRNKIVYDLASEIGLSFSPESRWADLYLNGEYAGLYLLTERNEIHPQRVAITPDGFLVSLELENRLQSQNYPYVRTACGTILRIHQSGMSKDSLQTIWESAENAIFAEDGIDPRTGKVWTELIDLDSWARKYLLEELVGNYDAGSVSQYFYYDQDVGKIFAGPVWDMDNTMGADNWTKASNAILAGRIHMWSDEDAPLFYELLKKDAFMERVIEQYWSDCRPALERLCDSELDAYSEYLSAAQRMNWKRWPQIAWKTDIETIRSYLQARMSFMDCYLENKADYVTVSAWMPYYIWSSWALLPGEILEPLPEEEGFVWCDLETGLPYEFGIPVDRNMILQLKNLEELEGETQ